MNDSISIPTNSAILFDEVQGGNRKILAALERNHKLNRRIYAALIAILEKIIIAENEKLLPKHERTSELLHEAIQIAEGLEEFNLPPEN